MHHHFTIPSNSPSRSVVVGSMDETRDIIKVESFSQLPFIRPAPQIKDESGAIRLFGKDFGGIKHPGEPNNPDQISSSRKFECHYCCRNFPTSQALGGHQNAHKRERQHAKRGHLHSALMHGGLSDAHVYGLINYSRLGSSSAPALPTPYHSNWNTISSPYSVNTNKPFYGSHHHPHPINGSPLTLWRIPTPSTFTHERAVHQQAPIFNSMDGYLNPLSSASSSSTGLGSQSRFSYEPKTSIQDPVSLDLHL